VRSLQLEVLYSSGSRFCVDSSWFFSEYLPLKAFFILYHRGQNIPDSDISCDPAPKLSDYYYSPGPQIDRHRDQAVWDSLSNQQVAAPTVPSSSSRFPSTILTSTLFWPRHERKLRLLTPLPVPTPLLRPFVLFLPRTAGKPLRGSQLVQTNCPLPLPISLARSSRSMFELSPTWSLWQRKLQQCRYYLHSDPFPGPLNWGILSPPPLLRAWHPSFSNLCCCCSRYAQACPRKFSSHPPLCCDCHPASPRSHLAF